ncbi:Hypothetical protein NTJ_13039 [Nesidiocoris tenuis]|uniref:Reverse transcriptase domain-containing protein n=1 Tax=Nesidiocoris tenuis TaxID=355587 RepID=A0ABN7BBM6_9HEMI|nr:Hypothetical protein NTJ_13039 [Nesidiocoris tenuis]
MSSRLGTQSSITVDAIVTPKISFDVPSVRLPKTLANGFAHLELADDNFFLPSTIDILLGVQASLDILSEPVDIIRGNPSATKTIFGYVLSGNIDTPSPTTRRSFVTRVLPTDENSVENLLRKFWELEEVEVKIPPSPEDQWCEQHFSATIRRKSDGRYVASLPFKDGQRPVLESNRSVARSRLSRLENRFARDPAHFALYSRNLSDYLSQGHMVESTTEAPYLLTHHGVTKESTTSPLRVVFNPSENSVSGKSLNDYLCTGPKLQSDIGNVTLAFRLQPVALSCDVQGMYRAIELIESDREFQHFLFRFSLNEPVREWELTTVTFGMTSSPYIAQRVLRQLIEDEGHRFPLGATVLSRSCYVDNIVCSTSSTEEALTLHHELTKLLAAGGFILRKWASSHAEVSEAFLEELKDRPPTRW